MHFAISLLGLVPLASAAAVSPEFFLLKRDNDTSTQNFTDNLAGYNVSRVGPSNANCTRSMYQLNVTSNNTIFQNVDSNANQTVLTALIQDFLLSPQNFTETYEQNGTQSKTNTYTISGTFCTPLNATNATNTTNVQLLVHGVGFDSSYWDFSPDGETDTYSYVSAAAASGLTTFRYDRLGTGLSDHPQDAFNEVQGATDLAIVTQFAQLLRNGSFAGYNFTQVVGVGHSYGSVQLQGLTVTSPDLLDGVLLQGFSVDADDVGIFFAGGAFESATAVAPNRFSPDNITNAYLVNADKFATEFDFFFFPYFDDEALTRAFETEQPAAAGVFFTQSSLIQPAANFTGPVHVVTGAKDLPFCSRNCYAVPEGSNFSSIPAFVQELYPQTSNFSVYIPENVGHAVNAHFSAPEVYQEMIEFVQSVFNNSTSSST